MAATRQTEVVTAHLDPLEVRRRGQHLTQQLVVGGLEPGPLAQGQPRLGDALGEVVAQLLEVAETKHPGLAADGGNPVWDLNPAESLGEETGERALEAADLPPQLDPGKALVDLDVEPVQAVSFEQIRHRPGSECRSPPSRGKPKTG
ncbi:MAG: hypothetical protein WA862_08670 [Solirubrobacterales bacterium]